MSSVNRVAMASSRSARCRKCLYRMGFVTPASRAMSSIEAPAPSRRMHATAASSSASRLAARSTCRSRPTDASSEIVTVGNRYPR